MKAVPTFTHDRYKSMSRNTNHQPRPTIAICVVRALGWTCVGAIACLSLVPGSARPHVVDSGQLEHVAAYAGTAALLAAGYPARWQLACAFALLPAYAVVLEAMQILATGRTAQLIDILASSAGAWAGLICARLLRLILTFRTGQTSERL